MASIQDIEKANFAEDDELKMRTMLNLQLDVCEDALDTMQEMCGGSGDYLSLHICFRDDESPSKTCHLCYFETEDGAIQHTLSQIAKCEQRQGRAASLREKKALVEAWLYQEKAIWSPEWTISVA